MIIADIGYDVSDEHLKTHISILKDTGADVFVFAGIPANAAQAIRIAADLNWHPVFIVNSLSASISGALKPAGIEKSVGVISATFLKDVDDPAWKDDAANRDWLAFRDKYYNGPERDDSAALYGYAAAETLAQVLRAMWRRLVSRKRHEASGGTQSLPAILLTEQYQDHNRSLGLSSNQATATASVRRPPGSLLAILSIRLFRTETKNSLPDRVINTRPSHCWLRSRSETKTATASK